MSKSLVFTDIHFGINSDKPSRQKIASQVIDEIVGACTVNGVDRIFFLGDLFHHRTSIEVSTLNLADSCVTKLASVAELFLLQGNHDLYEKSGRSLSSTSIFTKFRAHVIARPTEFTLNNQTVLLVPWCGDAKDVTIGEFAQACGCHLSGKKYDILMGHFNLTDGIDIERAYGKVKDTLLKNELGVGGIIGYSDAVQEAETQAMELFGYTHPSSHIYLGHIHEHQECVFAKRLFHIVGSPQMQVHDLKGLDPNRKRHGYYILDDLNRAEFFEIQNAPKFITVYASEIKKPTKDTEDKIRSLKGCIVKRCYDCSLTEDEQKAFDATIGDSSVLEEDTAVFVDSPTSKDILPGASSENDSTDSTLYNVSKEDFLRNVAGGVLKEATSANPLDEKEFNRRKDLLVEKLSGYYGAVSGF